jgi:hypothetical protein
MRSRSLARHTWQSGKAFQIPFFAATGLIFSFLFLFLFNGPAGSAVTIPNCTQAQMAICSGCGTSGGVLCCSDTGACGGSGATNCSGMSCRIPPGNACNANACMTVPKVPDCTKTQLNSCPATCPTGSICCTTTGTCVNQADCTGTSCGNSQGLCNSNACTVVPQVPACTQSQTLLCNGCPTGVVCCTDTGGCAPAGQADCQSMSCGNPLTGLCNANACNTVSLQCPNWSHTVTFQNNTSSTTIWLAAIPGCYQNGSCAQNIAPPTGGWGIAPKGGQASLTIPACWSGGFILREGCNFTYDPTTKQYSCSTSPCCDVGDCTDKATNKSAYTCNTGGQPPVTRIEVTFDGGYDTNGVKINNLNDYYDISYVDGFSKMATMQPAPPQIWDATNPSVDPKYWCTVSGCSGSTVSCPAQLVNYKISGQSKTALGCWSPGKYAAQHSSDYSAALRANLGCVCNADTNVLCNIGSVAAPVINPACNASNNTTFGCSPFSQPGQSNPNSQCCPWATTDGKGCGWPTGSPRIWPQWAKDYVSSIKTACPNAYAWQYDDASSTYQCRAGAAHSGQPINYIVNIYDVTLPPPPSK